MMSLARHAGAAEPLAGELAGDELLGEAFVVEVTVTTEAVEHFAALRLVKLGVYLQVRVALLRRLRAASEHAREPLHAVFDRFLAGERRGSLGAFVGLGIAEAHALSAPAARPGARAGLRAATNLIAASGLRVVAISRRESRTRRLRRLPGTPRRRLRRRGVWRNGLL
jgi:hypothetical protein